MSFLEKVRAQILEDPTDKTNMNQKHKSKIIQKKNSTKIDLDLIRGQYLNIKDFECLPSGLNTHLHKSSNIFKIKKVKRILPK